jgi:Putative peptidoglycan binding domain
MSVLKRTALTSVAMSLGLAVGMTLTSSPAGASVAQGYVKGADVVTDDFGDEGPIDHDSHRHSNATLMWQEILQSDGYYHDSLDCDFGPATVAATKAWQRDHGLSQDGSAGPGTLSKADGYLEDLGSGNINYYGERTDWSVTFRRVNALYYVQRDGYWYPASYTSASACGG